MRARGQIIHEANTDHYFARAHAALVADHLNSARARLGVLYGRSTEDYRQCSLPRYFL